MPSVTVRWIVSAPVVPGPTMTQGSARHVHQDTSEYNIEYSEWVLHLHTYVFRIATLETNVVLIICIKLIMIFQAALKAKFEDKILTCNAEELNFSGQPPPPPPPPPNNDKERFRNIINFYGDLSIGNSVVSTKGFL